MNPMAKLAAIFGVQASSAHPAIDNHNAAAKRAASSAGGYRALVEKQFAHEQAERDYLGVQVRARMQRKENWRIRQRQSWGSQQTLDKAIAKRARKAAIRERNAARGAWKS